MPIHSIVSEVKFTISACKISTFQRSHGLFKLGAKRSNGGGPSEFEISYCDQNKVWTKYTCGGLLEGVVSSGSHFVAFFYFLARKD